ncbi:MAG: hypothetical protein R3C19_02855 [Planctomycetaceae bacterium]
MLIRRFYVVVLMVVAANSPQVFAQYYGDGCSSCGPVAAAPMASCVPIQPVAQTCYQTVPVTTYQREQQTVKVPYYKTAYREQEVTVMRPVTQQRVVEVPTVSYQNVTEYRTVNRDMGRWVTQYQPVQKCAPCQVDPRPGLIGWMSRTGYSFRSAFQPNYTTSRQYVPQMMACTVPYTRQVAIQGTRQVTVSETKMVAEKKLERIPVQELAYREETVTVMRPQTAYRTVPIGTSMAYGYGSYGYGTTSTAFAPIIIDSTRTALNPEPDPISDRPRSAQAPFRADDAVDSFDRAKSGTDDVHRSSYETPLQPAPSIQQRQSDPEPFNFDSSTKRESDPLTIPAAYRPTPSTRAAASNPASNNVSASGWKARRRAGYRDATGTSLLSERVSLTQKSDN